MKRCPECRRDYYDETLLYCLDDGTALLEGPSTESDSGEEPATAILDISKSTVPLSTSDSKPAGSKRVPVWAAITLAALVIFGLGYAAAKYFARSPAAQAAIRFPVTIPEKTWFVTDVEEHNVAISPDGRQIVFVLNSDGKTLLYLRTLDQIAAKELPGTENAYSPFWSPDSRQIAFFAEGKLKKLDPATGVSQTICDVEKADTVGSWGSRGEIVFLAYAEKQNQIHKVSEGGGKPATIYTTTDEDYLWPHFLPDGQHFVLHQRSLSRTEKPIDAGIFVGSLDGSPLRSVVPTPSTRVEYAAPGYLLYVREGTLLAQRFDTSSLSVNGDPVPVLNGVTYFDKTGWAEWSISQTGVLVHPSNFKVADLMWIDRAGNEISRLGPRDNYSQVRLSPDGSRIAATVNDPQTMSGNILIYDLSGASTRFVYGPSADGNPVWSPDGRRLAYFATNGTSTMHIKDVNDISGEGESPLEKGFMVVTDWSRDGRFLLYGQNSPEVQRDIWALPLEGERKPIPFQTSQYSEYDARFSPDGRYVAFTSNESGSEAVYVAPFDRPAEKLRISPKGSSPIWSRDGKEIIFYSGTAQMMSVGFAAGDPPKLGTPTVLFDASTIVSFDISPDGSRFLVSRNVPSVVSAPLNVITNWTEMLQK